MMELKEAIYGRRSIRKYQPKRIEREILEDIMASAVMAPSAVNYQPWYFVVIQDGEKMKELNQVLEPVSERLKDGLVERFPTHPEVVEDTCQFFRKLGGAPCVVLAFQDKDDYGKTLGTIIQSVAAAIENMLLAAWDQGIGTCWMTAPIEADLSNEVRMHFAPDKGPLVAMITMGYPAMEAKMPRRKANRYEIL